MGFGTYHVYPKDLLPITSFASKNTRYSRNHKNLNSDAKIGALQVEKKQIIIYYLSVN